MDRSPDVPDLTADQRAAVEATECHVLVIGGPGTGKTHTLIARVAEIVRRGVPADAILVTTFARGAAAEVRERLEAAGFGGATARTLHAYAASLIATDKAGYGISGGLRFWSDDEMNATIRRAAAAQDSKWDLSTKISDLVLELKERMNDLEAVRVAHPSMEPAHLLVVQACLAGYERVKAQAGALDYSDMVPMVVRRMDADADYRRSVAAGLRAVLVDEFQDLNPPQAVLLDHLVSEGASLWAVGDDDQCLYGFRAADPRRLVNFSTRYPGALVAPLTRNRRCGSEIVKASQDLIANNRTRVPRPRQESTSGARGAVRLTEFDTDEEEALFLIRLAEDARTEGRSLVVLARSGWRLKTFLRLAAACGVSWIESMTVHKAKGKEWDSVALIGFEQGTMPSRHWRDLEEERRVAYVGMTRARTSLDLTVARRLQADRFDRTEGPFWDETQGLPGWTPSPPVDRPLLVAVNDTVWIEVPGGIKHVDRLVTSRSDFIDGQLVGKAVGSVIRMNPNDSGRTGTLMRIDKFIPHPK